MDTTLGSLVSAVTCIGSSPARVLVFCELGRTAATSRQLAIVLERELGQPSVSNAQRHADALVEGGLAQLEPGPALRRYRLTRTGVELYASIAEPRLAALMNRRVAIVSYGYAGDVRRVQHEVETVPASVARADGDFDLLLVCDTDGDDLKGLVRGVRAAGGRAFQAMVSGPLHDS